MAGLSPSLTSASLRPLLQTGPPLPSIADSDYRALATDRNLDKMPKACHLRGTTTHLSQLDLTLGLKEIPAAKFFFNTRCSASIRNVGAVPAHPITNFRPLFPLPLQHTMSAHPSATSPSVLSRWPRCTNGNSPSSPNPNNKRSRRTLASPQRRVPPARPRGESVMRELKKSAQAAECGPQRKRNLSRIGRPRGESGVRELKKSAQAAECGPQRKRNLSRIGRPRGESVVREL